MESINEDNTHGPQVEIPLSMDSVESKMLEVGQAERRTITAMEEVEETLSDIDTLERIRNNMTDSVEEGGLTPEAAEMAEIAVESIMARFGIKKTSVNGIVSLECFEKQHTRVIATKLSAESIGETIKKGWERVIEMLKKAYKWFVEIIQTMADGTATLELQARAMKSRAEKIQGVQVDTSIENTRLAARLIYKEECNARSTLDGLKATNRVIDGYLDAVFAIDQALGEVINKLHDDSDKAAQVYAKVGDGVPRGWTRSKTPYGNTIARTEELVSNLCMEVQFKERPEGYQFVQKSTLVTFKPNSAQTTITKVQAATSNEVTAICEEIVRLSRLLRDGNELSRKISKKMDRILTEFSKNTAQATLTTLVVDTVNAAMTLTKSFNEFALKQADYTLQYCSASLKAYK